MSNCKRSAATTCGWFMALLLSALLAGCGGGGGGGTSAALLAALSNVLPGAAGTPGASTTNPTVISSSPSSGAVNVSTGTNTNGTVTGKLLTATFNEPMTLATIIAPGTITLKVTGAVSNLPGAVTMNGANTIATFTPVGLLTPGSNYTVTVTTAAKNAAGTAMPNPVVWTFTANAVAIIDPSATVIPGVAGSAGAAATNPTVISTNPSSGATNVPTNTRSSGNVLSVKVVTATFNEAMALATITTVGTFTLRNNTLGVDVPGTVTMNGATTIATFTPTAATLNAATNYTAKVTSAATSASGTAMPNPVAWSFTTTAALFTGQAPVDLGKAGTFAIFTNTAVTSVFPSDIKGNVGTAGTGSNTTIVCPEVTAGGKVFTIDATFSDAVCNTIDATFVGLTAIDLAAAVTDAKTRAIPDSFNDQTGAAGNISGLVLAPGLYKWTTGVLIDNTGITITGGANDVWIFQIGGDLTLQNNAIITLGGSAQAKNIFWQVGGVTGAIIGSAVQFKGIILADAGITLTAGSTVIGRLFASPAITLITNTITPPAP